MLQSVEAGRRRQLSCVDRLEPVYPRTAQKLLDRSRREVPDSYAPPFEPVLADLSSEVEEAALSLGARPWQVFLWVILPAIMPALLTGFALALARGIGEYGSVIFICRKHAVSVGDRAVADCYPARTI